VTRIAPLGAIDYASVDVPSRYHCGKCGVRGVKLWREYQTFLNHQSLLCGNCACAEQSAQRSDGKTYTVEHRDDRGHVQVNGERGDQIGWRIPAVPTANGETYWGYSSVPDEGVEWWLRLPLRLGDAK
jgi:hypothetical protein